jgi:hypothetical protein
MNPHEVLKQVSSAPDHSFKNNTQKRPGCRTRITMYSVAALPRRLDLRVQKTLTIWSAIILVAGSLSQPERLRVRVETKKRHPGLLGCEKGDWVDNSVPCKQIS